MSPGNMEPRLISSRQMTPKEKWSFRIAIVDFFTRVVWPGILAVDAKMNRKGGGGAQSLHFTLVFRRMQRRQ